MRFSEVVQHIPRVLLSGIFLWAFFDKLFGWGFSTLPEQAWIAGGSPTTGYLTFAVHGPFAEAFKLLAGNVWVDWLFMLGLLGIGAGLLIPKTIRFAAISGIIMLLLMYFSALTPEHNPLIDEHLVYSAVLLAWAVKRS